MNFLKKKLKPLTSGLTSATTNITSNSHSNHKNDKADKDLEDDLYDEYVIEAPPHPSELLALGVDPTDIDVNDPEKLKELYRKAKEEGKDKQTNSVLLAKQRQKEEIEQKKKTREEWKFFDSITARVEQVVKDSQKTLDQLKVSSAVDELTKPDYELRLSADEVFKSSAGVKQEKSANNWIDFSEEENSKKKEEKVGKTGEDDPGPSELDEFGCPKERTSIGESATIDSQQYIVEELLEDFGIDLRPAQQKKKVASQQVASQAKPSAVDQKESIRDPSPKLDIDLKVVARPRPRPNAAKHQDSVETNKTKEDEVDPFDTSFVAAPIEANLLEGPNEEISQVEQEEKAPVRALDPFDTSYVNL